jgi:hypothetical protein
MSMANLEAFYAQTIAYLNISSPLALTQGDITTFCKSLKRHQAYTPVFICKIWPNDVIENVRFDCMDSEW